MDKEIKKATKIVWRIRDVYLKHMNQVYEVLSQNNFHTGQPRILHVIRTMKGTSQKKIAEELNIAPATLNVSIKRMEKSGLVERMYEEGSSRKSTIKVTKECEKKLDKLFGELAIKDEKMLNGFNDEEIDQLMSYLNRMFKNLE